MGIVLLITKVIYTQLHVLCVRVYYYDYENGNVFFLQLQFGTYLLVFFFQLQFGTYLDSKLKLKEENITIRNVLIL